MHLWFMKTHIITQIKEIGFNGLNGGINEYRLDKDSFKKIAEFEDLLLVNVGYTIELNDSFFKVKDVLINPNRMSTLIIVKQVF